MKKKLIETALPLEAINAASAREKSIRHGHPSTLHLWWARRPLAAARAVIFAQLVDDPSAWPELFPTPAAQEQERQRLFRLLEELVRWENTTNEGVLERARAEIRRSWARTCLGAPAQALSDAEIQAMLAARELPPLPGFHDPFAGGGSLPLEAQRLGLEAFASDLNPVAVLICKAMIEIPPRFAGLPPVNPASRTQDLGLRGRHALSGADGLAEGDGPGQGNVWTGEAASEGGSVRDALPAHPRGDLDPREHRRGMGEGVGKGTGAVPGDRPGFTGGDRDTADALRGIGLVPPGANDDASRPSGRGQQDAEHPPSQAAGNPLSPGSYSLFARQWKGAQGLAEDVRYYGRWMREEAERRIGHLYPKVKVYYDPSNRRYYTREEVDSYWASNPNDAVPLYPKSSVLIAKELTVIAWLWARTVRSPNPAFAHVEVPLASTFMLSTKPGKEAYVEVVREQEVGLRTQDLGLRTQEIGVRTQDLGLRGKELGVGGQDLGGREDTALPGSKSYVLPANRSPYRFTVKVGRPPDPEAARRGTKLGRGANFRCILSGAPITGDYIKAEGRAGRMGARLMAIVAEGERGRVYLSPTPEHEEVARKARPEWKPDQPLPDDPRNFWTVQYGLTTYGDLFTPRQLVALTTFSDLVGEAMERVKADFLRARASGPHHPGPRAAPQAEPLGARASGPHPSLSPRGWYSRGYHPHFDLPGLIQAITFRLHDSVPAQLLQAWRSELAITPDTPANDPRRARLRGRIARYEDAGHGACWLADARIAAIVEDALLHFDGERYRLLEWCVMPNHVHVLIETSAAFPLAEVVRSWKTFTAREANRMLGRSGEFWMAEYHDRLIRDPGHLQAVRQYIRNNPVAAGLCATPEGWRWSSAWGGRAEPTGEGEMRAGGPRTQGDDLPLREGGIGPQAYAEAVGVYLAIALSRLADICNALCRWELTKTQVRNLFGRQAIPMVWDFAENNVFGAAAGDYMVSLTNMVKALEVLSSRDPGLAEHDDAQTQTISADRVISSDPPYYDNVGYADLSDFFYVWLRRSLKGVFPDLFATVAVPKEGELVATPYRHGGKEKAEAFFLEGMTRALGRIAAQAHPAFPVTIYYAFKQQEAAASTQDPDPGDDAADLSPKSYPLTAIPATAASTGWETFLAAVLRAGFAVTGTWPMRTELGNRMIGRDTNALASSIVLACRRRPADAPTATRREFLNALQAELPTAVRLLQGLEGEPLGARASGPPGAEAAAPRSGRPGIAPVDLAQAAIGPGMAVFTRYARVLDARGRPLAVREALALINQVLDEVLASQEGDFDADTRWALAWFEQVGFAEGEFGLAETLSKAKNTSVAGMVEAGILTSRRGRVRLLQPAELPADWDPATDPRLTAWEIVHHLIRALDTGGEEAAAALAARLGARAEVARELAYRLYAICERKRRAAEALAYNGLVQSWPEIARLARAGGSAGPRQAALFADEEG